MIEANKTLLGSDSALFSLIDQEYDRQCRSLELIASENCVSNAVLRAAGSVLTNKYAEGLPGRRYYGGCEVIDEVERMAIERACALFNASWANVQPHSGAQANAAVMLALLKPGDTLLGFDLAHGGHLTHGSPVNYSGKLYRATFYGLNKETDTLDYDHIESVAIKEKPRLMICGASAYPRDWNYEALRGVADRVGATLLADIAHPAGLIARGLLNDPLEHCHVVTTTTHKTLRGPRGGMILIRHDTPNPLGLRTKKGALRSLSSVLNSGVFPGTQGGPLEHVIAAKAVAFGEAQTDAFLHYVKRVQKNARALAEAFAKRDYKLITNGTDNHLLLIDLRHRNITGKQAEDALGRADITLNKNMVPFDTQSPLHTSGIRIGTPALTTRGLETKDMEQIADWIDHILQDPNNETLQKRTKADVNAFMRERPLFVPS